MALPPRSSLSTPAAAVGHPLQLALDASELRYRRLFETAQDGILILNGQNGRIVDANPFVLDLLDYPFESIVGLELWEIGLFEDITANRAAFEQLQKNEYIRYDDHPLRTKSGKSIQVEFVSNVYRVGADRVIQCNIRDIRERRKFESAAARRVTELEIAGTTKDEIIAVLSHELRTPLAAINSMVDLVELELDLTTEMTGNETQARGFDHSAVALIRRNVQTLARLMNELLELTRIAKGGLQLKIGLVDAHDTINFVLKNFETMQKTKGIEIVVRLLARQSIILADAVKFEQVLTNLIGNAIKFTGAGGRVSVVTRNEGGERLVVEVSDTGIGIASDSLSRIFTPFEQSDASIHPRYGGLGLGLSIAKALTHAHGGTIEAASEGLTRGSTFTARFNLEGSPHSKKEKEPSAEEELRSEGRRILLVDDQEDLLRNTCELLQHQGYDVRTAINLESALALSLKHSFDLLITDVELPDGNGLDLLMKMREVHPQLQGIATTGFGMPDDVRATLAAGFTEHLEKPVNFPVLRAAIERLSSVAKGTSQRRMRAD